MIEHSENITELFKALHIAQGADDPRLEAKALQAITPVRKRSGRQHSQTPTHVRILEAVRMGTTGCWHWCGPTNAFGYGRLSVGGKATMAHRASYEAFRSPIPSGMSVLHSCDNPACVNPEHLRLGTYSDNRRECQEKGRWKMKAPRRGFDHPCNSVGPEALEAMRELRASGLSYSEIGRRTSSGTMVVWRALKQRFGGVR